MITRLLISIAFLTTVGCGQKTDNPADCNPYFTFDQVDYYSILITEDSVFKLIEKEIKTIEEDQLEEILMFNKPDTISDTLRLQNIETLGYKKKEVQREKFDQLDNIFCKRNHEDAIYYACASIYRDILVFKKQGKTIGFAKVCFDCGSSIIVGTDKDWSQFGQSGDIHRLGV